VFASVSVALVSLAWNEQDNREWAVADALDLPEVRIESGDTSSRW